MTEKEYQICTRCVMDTTDPEIVFDGKGVCNHCHEYDKMINNYVFTGDEGRQRLEKIIDNIKIQGKGKDYDCIIGVSGGVDSTYVAYLVKEYGLRSLAVHLDNGWNSELAVKNIEHIVKMLKIDLYTHVIDWEEFKDLQLAFLYASTPDSEIPSDHAIVSLIHQMAEKEDIKYIIGGTNIRTETHMPPAWSQGHGDWRYIKSVHDQFGKLKLTTYPHINLFKLYYLKTKIKWFSILNYVDYVKKDAKETLKSKLCWKDYGWKHYESIYTRLYQGYILPRKFGYDKRRPHLSSLICSGEETRTAALEELKEEPYPHEIQESDRIYAIKKFGITDEEFERIMKLPVKSYCDFPNLGKIYKSKLYHPIQAIYRMIK